MKVILIEMYFLAETDLLVLSALGTESVCRFVWSEVVTPIAVPPRAIWLPINKKICERFLFLFM